MSATHPRCELCAENPEGVHCWTHEYDEEAGDPEEGVYRCRHCTGVGRECEDCLRVRDIYQIGARP